MVHSVKYQIAVNAEVNGVTKVFFLGNTDNFKRRQNGEIDFTINTELGGAGQANLTYDSVEDAKKHIEELKAKGIHLIEEIVKNVSRFLPNMDMPRLVKLSTKLTEI